MTSSTYLLHHLMCHFKNVLNVFFSVCLSVCLRVYVVIHGMNIHLQQNTELLFNYATDTLWKRWMKARDFIKHTVQNNKTNTIVNPLRPRTFQWKNPKTKQTNKKSHWKTKRQTRDKDVCKTKYLTETIVEIDRIIKLKLVLLLPGMWARLCMGIAVCGALWQVH